VAEPSSEKADDCDSRLEGADNSESKSRSEGGEERRGDSETLNQPRPKRTRRTQRMRQCCDSKEAEKGRCRPRGSMLCKERTEEHVRGRPKDHTSNMQTEFRGTAKTRNSVGRRKHEIPCVGGKTPKLRRLRNSMYRREDAEAAKATEFRVSAERRQNSENTEFRVLAKIRNSVFWRKNVETPNTRNSTTCSKTSGIRPERKTSKNLDIRKNGENRRPMQNRILEQVSSAERRTSGPSRRA
jgi:hypothetical protein